MEKDLLNNSPQQYEENHFSSLAEQILNESLLNYRIDKLRDEIDKALMERNKESFLELSEKLNNIITN